MDALFVGQLALMPYGFVPSGWFECDGRVLNTQAQSQLFAVIGYTYGGSGTAFNLPDFRGRAMVCRGAQPGGETYEIGDAAHAAAGQQRCARRRVADSSDEPNVDPVTSADPGEIDHDDRGDTSVGGTRRHGVS